MCVCIILNGLHKYEIISLHHLTTLGACMRCVCCLEVSRRWREVLEGRMLDVVGLLQWLCSGGYWLGVVKQVLF